MNVLFAVVLIVLTAKILSKVTKRFGFGTLIAEFGTGLVLGISLFHLIAPKDVEVFANFGVILLMFLVGYESVQSGLIGRKNFRISFIAIAGLSLTLIALFFFGMFFFKLNVIEALFFTFAFALTDEAVSARTLVSIGKLKTKIGGNLVTIALIDTIIGFLLLFVSLAIITASSFAQVQLGIGKMALFFLVILMLFKYLHALFEKFKIKNSKIQFLIAFFIIFIISYVSNLLNLMAIGVIGAYFAGHLMQKTKDEASSRVCASLKSVAYGIFIPLFFAWVGLSVDIGLMNSFLLEALTICGVALAIKMVAVLFVSRFEKFSWKESLIYGIGTSARGNDGLVVLLVATTTPYLAKVSQLFIASLIMLIVISLIFSSISLKKLVK